MSTGTIDPVRVAAVQMDVKLGRGRGQPRPDARRARRGRRQRRPARRLPRVRPDRLRLRQPGRGDGPRRADPRPDRRTLHRGLRPARRRTRSSACSNATATGSTTPVPWSARRAWSAPTARCICRSSGVDQFADPGDRPFAVHEADGLTGRHAHLLRRQLPRDRPRSSALAGCRPARAPHELARPLGMRGRAHDRRAGRWRTPSTCWPSTASARRAASGSSASSSIADPTGAIIARAGDRTEEILYAEIDPARARQKRLVRVAGKHEINRFADRRPGFYGPIVKPNGRE